MRRLRTVPDAWTAAVVASATVALLGIALFMAHIHRTWWTTGPQGDRAGREAEAHAPAAVDDRPDASAPLPGGEGAGGALPGPAGVPAALVAALRERDLTIPVQGVAAASLVPSFTEPRGNRRHEALDIMAPTGTPVVAVEDGTIAKLFTSDAGGLTIYQFDPSHGLAYYYAHLERYASGLKEGATVRRGQVLGYVGSSGNADPAAPHLHFAIFRLGPDRHWWEGTAIDPYEVLR